jgi:hypothetical protein
MVHKLSRQDSADGGGVVGTQGEHAPQFNHAYLPYLPADLAQADAIAQLHGQMRGCDELLSGMEQMLSVFQADLGSISAEIQVLQVGGWRGLGFGFRPFCLTPLGAE